jgi:prepilin peptidase CpaA
LRPAEFFVLPSKEFMTGQVAIALLVGVAATAEDLVRRRVSNWIPLAALIGGLAWQWNARGWRGGISGVLGAAAGFAVFLVFYLLGGMGGGDVKLMAGFGAVLGIERLWEAALWTAGLGGLLAAGVLALDALWRSLRKKKDGAQSPVFIPYAPAIALGAWLSLVPRP